MKPYMLTRVVFVVAIVLALLSLVLPEREAIGVVAVAAVCFTAVLAAIDAGRAGRYLWVLGLVALAAILNPILPVALPPPGAVLLLCVSLAVLATWMAVLNRTVPPESIAQVLHTLDPK
jgi:hypothetical protein